MSPHSKAILTYLPERRKFAAKRAAEKEARKKRNNPFEEDEDRTGSLRPKWGVLKRKSLVELNGNTKR